MRFSKIIFPLMVMASPAMSDEICPQARHDILDATLVSADLVEGDIMDQVKLSFRVHSDLPQEVVMIEAGVKLYDPLGREFSMVWLDPDLHLAADADTSTQILKTKGTNLDRLLTIDVDKVTATVCTSALMFADGTVKDYSKEN